MGFLNELISITWDSFKTAKPEHILLGKKMFRPYMSYQQSWLAHFYPNDKIDLRNSTWFYLIKYVLPLIKRHASQYHIQGIKRLGLDHSEAPEFATFKKKFALESNGFELEVVQEEIPPREYFQLIQQKKFPCIQIMRQHEELFCANAPDFWHEAIGHIAPLCFAEVQQFYLQLAEFVLSTNNKSRFEQHMAVAWTLSEYGFIQESNTLKMFGAALVGSHLAHMRYVNHLIDVEPAYRETIIDSGFYLESKPTPKNSNGHLRFFYLQDLDFARLFTTSSL